VGKKREKNTISRGDGREGLTRIKKHHNNSQGAKRGQKVLRRDRKRREQ